jgi:hypothetical protein
MGETAMSLWQIVQFLAMWGLVALVVLVLALARARRSVFHPVAREDAPAKTCSNCRLPFHRSSWRCGRCGAYMRPRLFYWIGRYILEPLLALLVVPWILLFGMTLSGILMLTDRFLPSFARTFERLTSRLGVWVTPLFGKWVPEEWQLPVKEATVTPHEVDAPTDALVASALTVGTALLDREDEEVVVRLPHPEEDTLAILRHTPEGIREVWGYISDGHTLVPSFDDRIIAAECRGDELLEYTEGLAHHLEESLRQLEIRQMDTGKEGSEEPSWYFVLSREPARRGRYPIRWEVHAPPGLLATLPDRLDELHTWDSLPCRVVVA